MGFPFDASSHMGVKTRGLLNFVRARDPQGEELHWRRICTTLPNTRRKRDNQHLPQTLSIHRPTDNSRSTPPQIHRRRLASVSPRWGCLKPSNTPELIASAEEVALVECSSSAGLRRC
jgi:hypothetical protein